MYCLSTFLCVCVCVRDAVLPYKDIYGCFRLNIETGRSSRGSMSRKINHTERNVRGNVREVFFKKGEMKKAERGEMKTCGSKRQMRPHSFFAFIPLATFGLSPPTSPPPPTTFFCSLFIRFDARLKQQRLQYVQELSWRVERVDMKTCPQRGGGQGRVLGPTLEPSSHQQVGPSSCSLNMLVLLVTQLPVPFLCFLHFSTSAGFSPVLKFETTPPPPPPLISHLPPSIHSFFFCFI